MSKATDQFETVMKGSSAVDNGIYIASTAKRGTVTPPEGVLIYDEDLGKWFKGDGSANGGVSDMGKVAVRNVAVVESHACTDSGTDYSTFSWALASALRTGDCIIMREGDGTLPSGNPALTSAVYIKKDGDEGNGANNTGTTFKIANTRALALAGSTRTVLMSGVNFITKVSGVGLYGTEDVVMTTTTGGTLTVAMPSLQTTQDVERNQGVSVLVKRNVGTGSGVYVTEISGNGEFKQSGDANMGGAAAGSWLLKANTQDYVDLFSNGTSYQYRSQQITA